MDKELEEKQEEDKVNGEKKKVDEKVKEVDKGGERRSGGRTSRR